jgi:hypothetical protein
VQLRFDKANIGAVNLVNDQHHHQHRDDMGEELFDGGGDQLIVLRGQGAIHRSSS